MATSSQLSESEATQQQYLAQLALTAAIVQAIRNLWPSANPLAAPEKFRAALSALLEQFGQASASIATDYYRTVRAEAGITDALTIRPVEMPDQALVDSIIDRARAAEIEAAMQQRIEASVQKALADVARRQTLAAAEGDEFALGYRRIARPDACAWCIVLALRVSTRTRQKRNGKFVHDEDAEHMGVYKTRQAAGAASHFNCHCVIEPVFFHGTEEAGWLADMRELYDSFDPDALASDGRPYGRGVPGFRRALRDLRRGVDPTTPAAPQIVTPALNPAAIDALLDLLPQVA